MKITKRQLRKIIRESLTGLSENSQGNIWSVAVDLLNAGNINRALNKILDHFWMDDTWRMEEDALEDMLIDLGSNPTPEAVEAVSQTWLKGYRAGEYRPKTKEEMEADWARGNKPRIRESALLEYEQYVDEDGNIWDDEGNVTRKGSAFGRQYGGGTYGTNAPWQGGRSRSRYSSRRKTTSVSAGANDDKIAAIKKALDAKPNNFLTSILKQLQANRGLSSKQKAIVKRILAKTSPDDAKLFEGYRR